MQVIRKREAIAAIADPAIRTLVLERIDDLGGDNFDAAKLGYFLVIEPGDGLEVISTQIGFPILVNRSTGIKFGDPAFVPSFEFVEEIGNCYDTVFVICDDGFGIELFIPKAAGIPADLLAMCKAFAVPAITQ
jgi:hypothetical protein